MNIALVGFMGSGKTTVGRILAARTGREFVDIDAIIEKEQNMSIQDIFSRFGEKNFRELESAAVKSVSSGSRLIIAAGGGAVLDGENVVQLRKNGILVWLMVSFEDAVKRVLPGSGRPLLNVDRPEKALRDLLEARNPIYARSDIRVDTAGRTAEEVADEIAKITEGMDKNG